MSCYGQPSSKSNYLSYFARITKNWSFHLKRFIPLVFLVLFFSITNFAQELDYPLTLTNQDILDTIASFKTDNPSKTVELFKAKMPPVADQKTREKVLNDLPKKILALQIKDSNLEEKIRNLIKPILTLYSRENAYKLVIFKHSVPFVAIDTGTALFISSGFLQESENDDEVLGTVAHEIGHEYFIEYSLYTKHLLKLVKDNGKEIALAKKFGDSLAIIELNCDAFASVTMAYLGYNPTAFIEGLERITKKFKSAPKSVYPSETIRRQVVENIIPSSFINKTKRKFSLNLKEIKEIIDSKAT